MNKNEDNATGTLSPPSNADQRLENVENVPGYVAERNFSDRDEFGLPIEKSRRRYYDEGKAEEEANLKSATGRERGGSNEYEDSARPTSNQAKSEKSSEGGTPLVQSLDDKNPSPTSPPNGKSTGMLIENQPAKAEYDGPKSNRKSYQNYRYSNSGAAVSEWSHQQILSQHTDVSNHEDEDRWQEMPAYAPFDLYNEDGKLVAKEAVDSDEEAATYGHLGGAGKGYTRVQVDEDAQSATSMDDNTAYLFKEQSTNLLDDDEDARDPLAQMQATKDLLTEGQRIAYVGIVRLAMVKMTKILGSIERTRNSKKSVDIAVEAMKMWSQKMMVRLYSHMDIESAEQLMIEQLSEHGVEPEDLTPTLMKISRVKNPNAEDNPQHATSSNRDLRMEERHCDRPDNDEEVSSPLEYTLNKGDRSPGVQTPSQLPKTRNIDIDLRWTVLCDLFLVLIADSVYDCRSRKLLECVGASLEVPWLEICRFEKRVIDALEMQEAANKENWNEDDHLENRKKLARNRRIMMMGLATVGGSLVIGLSAGLLAPVIGAGLAAGFTTIGVAGTSGFLAGAGGAAIITTTGVVTGGTIAVRASGKRTGAVQTFEYRPLHNNKRVNLIITVAGWMNGKVDDVRLPFSTVDPIMGDIYSVYWEPEMLQSMGATINILATEALTQGLQQVLGSTILVALMASLQAPILLAKLSYLIDNPWSVSLARADMAGLILADSLIDRNLGVRPVTLVGFSLGSRVIFSCIRELANKGAFGLIQNVYIFGSPIVVKKDEYLKARAIIPGRFVNGYATNDWILGYLFRATGGGIMKVAGLAPVEIPEIENVNVTEYVNGHMAYRAAMPRLLRECGWMVESDEFTEIEDPDPENHEKRQRELITEIEEARAELQKKNEKRKFTFFKNKKATQKKEWEVYDDKGKISTDDDPKEGTEMKDGVLFDIDAIRAEAAELAAQGIEIKQLESTLPPIRLDTSSYSKTSQNSLRRTSSLNDAVEPHTFKEDINTRSIAPFQTESRKQGFLLEREHQSQGEQSVETAVSENRARESSLGRPQPQTTVSLPVLPLDDEHNAWIDEYDELGQELEMKMTFE